MIDRKSSNCDAEAYTYMKSTYINNTSSSTRQK